MPFKKGQSGNPKGKPKGTKSEFTNLKDSFLNVYKRLGGDDGMLEWARSDPKHLTAFYLMIRTMLPKEVQAEVRNNIIISWAEPGELPDPSIIDVTPELEDVKQNEQGQ